MPDLDMLPGDFVEAALRPSLWRIGDEALYRLCREHPGHKTVEEVIGKFLVIGRTYAAAVERRKPETSAGKHEGAEGQKGAGSSDRFYLVELAPAILGCDLDAMLAELPEAGPRNLADAGRALAVHQALMDVLWKITKQNKRSLASKYLHFHRPQSFFLFDARACGAARGLAPQLRECPAIPVETCDGEYRNFFRRCLWLQEMLAIRAGRAVSPRELDNLLLLYDAEAA